MKVHEERLRKAGLDVRKEKPLGPIPEEPEELAAERARQFEAIMRDARQAAPAWDAWAKKVRAVLDTIEALLEERSALEQIVFALQHRAHRVTIKYRGTSTGFEAECAKDYNACRRVIDARLSLGGRMMVMEAGIPMEVVHLLKKAVRERRAIVKRVRDVAEDDAALRNRIPEPRVEQPDGFGTYLGVNTLSEANGGKGDAQFVDVEFVDNPSKKGRS
jgi:hypothetical protein